MTRTSGRRAADLASAAAAFSAVAAVTGAFGWLLFDVARVGLPRLSWAFLTEPVADAGRAGGIGPLIVSTAAILGVCLAAAVPVGLGAAIFLSEYARSDRRLVGVVRRLLDVLAGVPSIVFGLFGLALFADLLRLGFSILSGGLTLACMVLPIFIRLVEQGLADVPDEHRLGAAALGISRATTLTHLLIPAAAPAIGAALMLGVGRALAETAALIFTAGYVTRAPSSLLDSGRALSVHVYDLAMNVPGGDDNAYTTAAVLVALLLAINATALALVRYAARHVHPHPGAGP